MSGPNAEGPPDERLVYVGDEFDELYVRGVEVHLERLDDGAAYLHVWDGSRTVHLDLTAEKKGRLVVTVNISEGVPEEYSE